jgi:hypothetical protein
VKLIRIVTKAMDAARLMVLTPDDVKAYEVRKTAEMKAMKELAGRK